MTNDLQKAYLQVIELSESGPLSDEFLQSCITLRSQIAESLSKSTGQLTEQEETQIIKDLSNWSSLLIWDIFSSAVEEAYRDFLFNQDLLFEEKLQRLWIKQFFVWWIILPPDYGTSPKVWSWTWWETKNWFDKASIFISILHELGIVSHDYDVITGDVDANSMRTESYHYFYLKSLDKTILINNKYGEVSFIYDGLLDLKYCFENGKDSLKEKQGSLTLKRSAYDGDFKRIQDRKEKVKWYLQWQIKRKVVEKPKDSKGRKSQSAAAMCLAYPTERSKIDTIEKWINEAKKRWFYKLKWSVVIKMSGWATFQKYFSSWNKAIVDSKIRQENRGKVFASGYEESLKFTDLQWRLGYAKEKGFVWLNTTKLITMKWGTKFHRRFSKRNNEQPAKNRKKNWNTILKPKVKPRNRKSLDTIEKWLTKMKSLKLYGCSTQNIEQRKSGNGFYLAFQARNIQQSPENRKLNNEVLFPNGRNNWTGVTDIKQRESIAKELKHPVTKRDITKSTLKNAFLRWLKSEDVDIETKNEYSELLLGRPYAWDL